MTNDLFFGDEDQLCPGLLQRRLEPLGGDRSTGQDSQDDEGDLLARHLQRHALSFPWKRGTAPLSSFSYILSKVFIKVP